MTSCRLQAPLVDAALVVVALLDAVVMTDTDRPYANIVAVVAALALAVRRRWPYLVFALALPATAVSSAVVAGAVALYTVAVNTRNRRTLAVCTILYSICSAAAIWNHDIPTPTRVELLVSVGYNIATAAAAIFLGQLVQARRDLQQRLTEIHQAREHEQQLVAQTVLAKERAQLAREMHDVVSHQVSLITIQAGALQVNTSDPDTKTTAQTIRDLAVRTLDELRHMVTVLRASGTAPTELTPQPTLAGLRQMISNSGIATRLDGDLPTDISAATQRAIYRTVQEALTNIRKHAPGATATIRIRHDDATVEVIITNTPPTRPTLPLPGARHGLIGLRERAELLGGAVTAGPTADNGYQIQLRLPATIQ
ncbi:two-component system sensor kinase [Micromonospora sp. ATCC 39149]|uniref:histidine kinase n=1 Tax=Micromonospora carbonacea TaxID=47853 RepID=A0A7D5Y6R3_9ACTN|nr:histidine kinase [Micromonospora sp. ATCC 39149]EEP70512.1 two-component system sensor kinase [Micromonospora sp. ATCC 39149]QLJ96901.1 two-component sensor histidine kinase [Micromonospora carbonacea]